jgi:uncharacterized protein (TIGR02271 family)
MRQDKSPTGPRATRAARGARLERAEERLVPEVESVEAGRVVLRKRTVTEPEAAEVHVRHDEVDLERVKADRPLADGEEPVREIGDETVVLVIEERLDVRKVPWVVEEIHVRRRLVTEPLSVSGDVRKERMQVKTTGDVSLTGKGGGPRNSLPKGKR